MEIMETASTRPGEGEPQRRMPPGLRLNVTHRVSETTLDTSKVSPTAMTIHTNQEGLSAIERSVQRLDIIRKILGSQNAKPTSRLALENERDRLIDEIAIYHYNHWREIDPKLHIQDLAFPPHPGRDVPTLMFGKLEIFEHLASQLVFELTLPLGFSDHLSRQIEDYDSMIHKSLCVLRYFLVGLSTKRPTISEAHILEISDRVCGLLKLYVEQDCRMFYTIKETLVVLSLLLSYAIPLNYEVGDVTTLATYGLALRLIKRVRSSETFADGRGLEFLPGFEKLLSLAFTDPKVESMPVVELANLRDLVRPTECAKCSKYGRCGRCSLSRYWKAAAAFKMQNTKMAKLARRVSEEQVVAG